MSDMLRVILRPTLNRHGKRLHGKFVVTLDGASILGAILDRLPTVSVRAGEDRA